MEFIIFGNGSTSSQKALMDDAKGGSGQRFGTVNVDSTSDQIIEIQIRKTGGGDNGVFDAAFAELLIKTD